MSDTKDKQGMIRSSLRVLVLMHGTLWMNAEICRIDPRLIWVERGEHWIRLGFDRAPVRISHRQSADRCDAT